ncbi:3-dehydrosphinganine reductase [Stygiomarasmius scandens]|uniref:3-dehydrosphinganine reductase n=1 Tax=Marasmiellus scandens TaxID=2682957 RepID=A0ABR1K5D6_9AGAR
MFWSKSWNPDGQHVYVTGGSTGLGLSVSILLVKKGAHVSIVARNQEKLNKALETLEAHRVSPSQKLLAYSFSLITAEDSEKAYKAVCAGHDGRAPDAVFNCAGASKPMFFVEMTKEDFEQGMANSFWIEAWTAWIAAKEMVRQGVKGKIVFVSSTLGYMTFVGWANYAPGRHALRGLGDTLESELRLYDIDVHTFFPPTMVTASYIEENKTKPEITKIIEGTDEGLTSEKAAEVMLRGIEKGQKHIAGDWITNSFRASTRGATHMNNFILDSLWNFFALFAVPVWRRSVDQQIEAHKGEHMEYLRKVGFLP